MLCRYLFFIIDPMRVRYLPLFGIFSDIDMICLMFSCGLPIPAFQIDPMRVLYLPLFYIFPDIDIIYHMSSCGWPITVFHNRSDGNMIFTVFWHLLRYRYGYRYFDQSSSVMCVYDVIATTERKRSFWLTSTSISPSYSVNSVEFWPLIINWWFLDSLEVNW